MSDKNGYKGRYLSRKKQKFPWAMLPVILLIAVMTVVLFLMQPGKQETEETLPATQVSESLVVTLPAEPQLKETLPTESVYADAIREFVQGYSYAEPMTYTFYDFDEDGDDELLLGSGDAIRCVLKAQDGQVQKIWESANQSYVYLCDGGILWDVSPRGNWFTDMEGNVEEFVYYREEPDSWYMKNKEKTADVPIDEAQAKEILSSFTRTYLDWKPITDYPAA